MANVFEVKKRSLSGTGGARATRREGFVPGIVYGCSKEPEMIQMDPRDILREAYKSGFFSKVYTVNLEGKSELALVKDLQLHPVSDMPLHIDFMRVAKGSSIHVHVPVEFINEDKCALLKRGGVLNVVLHTIELVCPVEAVPEKLVIDLSALGTSSSVHSSDLALPSGVKIAHPERDATVATIAMPSSSEASE